MSRKVCQAVLGLTSVGVDCSLHLGSLRNESPVSGPHSKLIGFGCRKLILHYMLNLSIVAVGRLFASCCFDCGLG